MSKLRTCERCGLQVSDELPRIGWPEDPSWPPLPPEANPHPPERCCSPFAIGDDLYWDLGGRLPDLPPVSVVFLGLTEFDGPTFRLEEGAWVEQDPLRLIAARVAIDPESHAYEAAREEGYDPEAFDVLFEELSLAADWPCWGPEHG